MSGVKTWQTMERRTLLDSPCFNSGVGMKPSAAGMLKWGTENGEKSFPRNASQHALKGAFCGWDGDDPLCRADPGRRRRPSCRSVRASAQSGRIMAMDGYRAARAFYKPPDFPKFPNALRRRRLRAALETRPCTLFRRHPSPIHKYPGSRSVPGNHTSSSPENLSPFGEDGRQCVLSG